MCTSLRTYVHSSMLSPYACIYLRVYMRMRVSAWLRAWECVRMCEHKNYVVVRVRACVHVCTCACICVCMCGCACVFMSAFVGVCADQMCVCLRV